MNQILELVPGMIFYRFKGFSLLRLIRYNKAKNEVYLQKLYSDTPEPPISAETLKLQIQKNSIKLLTAEEVAIEINNRIGNLLKSKDRINRILAALNQKEKYLHELRRHSDEYNRSQMRRAPDTQK